MFLKSKFLVPIEGPILPGGVLQIEDGRILKVGGPKLWSERFGECHDLSKHVVLPGFVNAHCHLELSALGPLPKRDESTQDTFTPWVRDLIEAKTNLSESDLTYGFQEGSLQLLSSGVTTVLDHISFNTPLQALKGLNLRVIPNLEILGAHQDIASDIYQSALQLKKDYGLLSPGSPFFISPHSVHALHPEVLQRLLHDIQTPLFIHLAESRAEADYFETHTGGLAELIRSRGLEIPPVHSQSGLDVLAQMQTHALARLTIVHGNHLTSENMDLIRAHRIPVIHCPGSYAYFKHEGFPLKALLSQRTIVALGTDSLASNESLNYLDELRRFAGIYPWMDKSDILTLATLNGAKALRMDSEIGSLVPGKKADLALFEIKDDTEDPIEAIFKAVQANLVYVEGHLKKG